MILILLHHRVSGLARATTSLSLLEEQIAFVAKHYHSVFPGETHSGRLNVCFTFDDAYVDFYHLIFPLLKKYHVKATVAPITTYTLPTSALSMQERLLLLNGFESIEKQMPIPDIYCTYAELKEMLASNLVRVACHSHTHPRLTKHTNLKEELLHSKELLEQHLPTVVNTLIYPYGHFDTAVHFFAKQHFSYILRIGSAINFHWKDPSQLYYRVPCDQMNNPLFPFSPFNRLLYLSKKCTKLFNF